MECPLVDFKLTGKRNMFKSGYVLVHRTEDVGNKDPLSINYLIYKETNPTILKTTIAKTTSQMVIATNFIDPGPSNTLLPPLALFLGISQ